MTSVAGASRFYNASSLANVRGLAAQSSNLLGSLASSINLLDFGRQNAIKGIGLSSNARLLNKQYLDSNKSTYNQIFSLGLGTTATVEGLQQNILALRAKTPDHKLARSLRGSVVDEEA